MIRRLGPLWPIVLASCTQLRTVTSSPDDYAAFRKTRLAPTLEERLAASVRYLAEHPSGAFVLRVEAFLRRAEPVYYASKRGSAAGLRTYLRVLPDGPHADEARRELAAIEGARAGQEEMARRALETEARLARIARQRTRAREESEAWIDRFADPKVFASPVAEGPSSFVVPWSLGLPAPACAPVDAPAQSGERTARRCTKIVELPFTVPAGGVAEERQVTLEIELDEDASGTPLRATLGGPGLFDRMHEAATSRPVSADDPTARADALARAAARVQAAVERHGPLPPDCRRPAESPVVLHLECNGLGVVVRAAPTPADDDTIEISPAR